MNPGLFTETDSLSPRTFASKSARIGASAGGPRSTASVPQRRRAGSHRRAPEGPPAAAEAVGRRRRPSSAPLQAEYEAWRDSRNIAKLSGRLDRLEGRVDAIEGDPPDPHGGPRAVASPLPHSARLGWHSDAELGDQGLADLAAPRRSPAAAGRAAAGVRRRRRPRGARRSWSRPATPAGRRAKPRDHGVEAAAAQGATGSDSDAAAAGRWRGRRPSPRPRARGPEARPQPRAVDALGALPCSWSSARCRPRVGDRAGRRRPTHG